MPNILELWGELSLKVFGFLFNYPLWLLRITVDYGVLTISYCMCFLGYFCLLSGIVLAMAFFPTEAGSDDLFEFLRLGGASIGTTLAAILMQDKATHKFIRDEFVTPAMREVLFVIMFAMLALTWRPLFSTDTIYFWAGMIFCVGFSLKNLYKFVSHCSSKADDAQGTAEDAKEAKEDAENAKELVDDASQSRFSVGNISERMTQALEVGVTIAVELTIIAASGTAVMVQFPKVIDIVRQFYIAQRDLHDAGLPDFQEDAVVDFLEVYVTQSIILLSLWVFLIDFALKYATAEPIELAGLAMAMLITGIIATGQGATTLDAADAALFGTYSLVILGIMVATAVMRFLYEKGWLDDILIKPLTKCAVILTTGLCAPICCCLKKILSKKDKDDKEDSGEEVRDTDLKDLEAGGDDD